MRDAHNKVNTTQERRSHPVSSIKMLRVCLFKCVLYFTSKYYTLLVFSTLFGQELFQLQLPVGARGATDHHLVGHFGPLPRHQGQEGHELQNPEGHFRSVCPENVQEPGCPRCEYWIIILKSCFVLDYESQFLFRTGHFQC